MTTNSLSRQPEKAHEIGGVPLRAIILSLALHALVLGALTRLPLSDATGNTPPEWLHAALRSTLEAVAVSAVPPAPTFDKLARRQPASAPTEQFAPTAPVRVVDVASIASGASNVATDVLARIEPATVALAAPVEAHGPDAAGLRQYRLALAGEARRFRRYPDAARRDGITGTAEVRVTVAAAGAARHAELARSSGHEVLDAAALDMLRQAAMRALLPESLRGQDFAVLLPVVFEVDE